MTTAEFLEKPYINLTHRRKLQTEIATLYGRDIAKETHKIESTRIKIQHKAVFLDFLKIFRDTNILPKFTIVKHHLINYRNDQAFDCLGFAIVRGEISGTCATLNNLLGIAIKLHLKLAHTLRADL